MELRHIFSKRYPYGGVTFGYRYDEETKTLFYTHSVCSRADQYSRKRGAELVIDRMNNGQVHEIKLQSNNPERREPTSEEATKAMVVDFNSYAGTLPRKPYIMAANHVMFDWVV